MIWLALALVAVAALLPLVWSARRDASTRLRRDAALALHRAQLSELDRDLLEGRLLPAEHEAAKLEVQRRLLAEAAITELTTTDSNNWLLAVVAAVIPVTALILYLYVSNGQPGFPPGPIPTDETPEQRQDDIVQAHLLKEIGAMEQHAEKTRQLYMGLGEAAGQSHNFALAAEAFKRAMAIKFEPILAAEAGETTLLANGQPTPEAIALLQRALDTAPKDAPWRDHVSKILSQATSQ
jgi:cytochrome c-type biogenesis protein CcmH